MTYSQIIQTIESVYFQIDQQWLKECLEIARKENLSFLTMQVFIDWACGEDEQQVQAPEVIDKWEAEDRAALMAAMEEEE